MLCVYPWCDAKAKFGIAGSKATLCGEHKEGYMLEKKCCVVSGCSSEPLFNRPGYLASFCEEHKADGMVETPACLYTGCDNLAWQGNFCAKHRPL
jgi:hypothetical protein